MIMNLLINTLLNRKQRLSHLLHGHDIWSHCKRERESAYRCERLHANVKGRDEERERERDGLCFLSRNQYLPKIQEERPKR